MNGIGSRLREERERLGLTQRAFGEIGGVEPNAQGRYESGDRIPRADYLAAVASRGVDALYVLCGERTPSGSDTFKGVEAELVSCLRQLPEADRQALRQLLRSLSARAGGRAL